MSNDQSASFSHLPAELLIEISSYINLTDLTALRCSARLINSVLVESFGSRAFGKLTIVAEIFGASIDILHHLANHQRFAKVVHHVDLRIALHTVTNLQRYTSDERAEYTFYTSILPHLKKLTNCAHISFSNKAALTADGEPYFSGAKTFRTDADVQLNYQRRIKKKSHYGLVPQTRDDLFSIVMATLQSLGHRSVDHPGIRVDFESSTPGLMKELFGADCNTFVTDRVSEMDLTFRIWLIEVTTGDRRPMYLRDGTPSSFPLITEAGHECQPAKDELSAWERSHCGNPMLSCALKHYPALQVLNLNMTIPVNVNLGTCDAFPRRLPRTLRKLKITTFISDGMTIASCTGDLPHLSTFTMEKCVFASSGAVKYLADSLMRHPSLTTVTATRPIHVHSGLEWCLSIDCPGKAVCRRWRFGQSAVYTSERSYEELEKWKSCHFLRNALTIRAIDWSPTFAWLFKEEGL